jgi:hypothetical protein
MKMIEGFFSLAIANRVFINLWLLHVHYFSDSPTYFDIKSEEDTEKNVPSASVAQAFAKYVFPVPGGPYMRIPFQGILAPSKICGNLIGKITAS